MQFRNGSGEKVFWWWSYFYYNRLLFQVQRWKSHLILSKWREKWTRKEARGTFIFSFYNLWKLSNYALHIDRCGSRWKLNGIYEERLCRCILCNIWNHLQYMKWMKIDVVLAYFILFIYVKKKSIYFTVAFIVMNSLDVIYRFSAASGSPFTLFDLWTLVNHLLCSFVSNGSTLGSERIDGKRQFQS